MSRSWPLRPAPDPVAQPLAAGPTAAVATAIQVSHQSFRKRGWGARRAGCSAPPGSPRRDGVRGTAGGCARARRWQRPGAPACAWSSGQTLFSPSVELRLVKRHRPPPPLPRIPRATDTRAGRQLKGNAAPFLRPRSAPRTPGAPRARMPRKACPRGPTT